MSIADYRCQQCSLCVNSYTHMHSFPLSNGIYSLESAFFEYSVHGRIEYYSCCRCSHDQRCKRWSRFSLSLHTASNALTASLGFCHVNFQVKIDMWSRGDTLQHAFPYQAPCWSKWCQFFMQYILWDCQRYRVHSLVQLRYLLCGLQGVAFDISSCQLLT